jgi:hypothetical protein
LAAVVPESSYSFEFLVLDSASPLATSMGNSGSGKKLHECDSLATGAAAQIAKN